MNNKKFEKYLNNFKPRTPSKVFTERLTVTLENELKPFESNKVFFAFNKTAFVNAVLLVLIFGILILQPLITNQITVVEAKKPVIADYDVYSIYNKGCLKMSYNEGPSINEIKELYREVGL